MVVLFSFCSRQLTHCPCVLIGKKHTTHACHTIPSAQRHSSPNCSLESKMVLQTSHWKVCCFLTTSHSSFFLLCVGRGGMVALSLLCSASSAALSRRRINRTTSPAKTRSWPTGVHLPSPIKANRVASSGAFHFFEAPSKRPPAFLMTSLS